MPAAEKLTDQGSKLAFGDTGTVIFESTQNKGTVLRLTVQSVQRGRLADFKGFILDDTYKKNASYYYAKVQVRNVGTATSAESGVPLWGMNAANTLLPAVKFTSDFAPVPVAAAAGEVRRPARRPEHLPGLPVPGQGRAALGELPAEPGVQPDHLDRCHPASPRR